MLNSPSMLRLLLAFAVGLVPGVNSTGSAQDRLPLVQKTAASRPNILFIAIDDLNDWLGCYQGHPQAQTPHIDALAARGVQFNNAHCQAPICNPSRISMLLGLLPSTTGHYFLSPTLRSAPSTAKSQTLFQYFREHGYFTSTRGKIFHGPVDRASFDEVSPSTGWRRPTKKLRYTLPGSHPLWDWGKVDIADQEMRDYQTAAWAAKRIPQLAEMEQPFFLAVGFQLPHVPLYASARWFDLHPLDRLRMPTSISHDLTDLPPYAIQLSLNPTAPRHAWMIESGEAKHAVQAYLATTSFVDHLVGMVLDGLAASSEQERTLVVLWSDHGFHLSEKQKWAKRSLWEEATRVPLVFSGSMLVPGKTDAPVGLVDVFPTLAELSGLPVPQGLDGQSLASLLAAPQQRWERPALCTFGRNNHSLRSQDFRYTVYEDGSEELYDHRADPHEWHNVAEHPSPKYARVMADMRQWLPTVNAQPVPGSKGSDSPLYGESAGLQKSMKIKTK